MDAITKGLKKARSLAKSEYVSEDGYDLCVRCKAKTQYKTETNINLRAWYKEGAGQLCESCHKEIYE